MQTELIPKLRKAATVERNLFNFCFMKRAFIIVFVLISCRSNTPGILKQSREDSLRNSLIGKWGAANKESSPLWEFTHDSMYWYNHKKSYQYTITGNDLVINSDDLRIHFTNIHVDKDTLFFGDKATEKYGIFAQTISFRHK